MEELISILSDIKYELEQVNGKLEDIKGYGLDNSIPDINEKLDDIKGSGLYDSISDVNNKLDEISSTASNIDTNTM